MLTPALNYSIFFLCHICRMHPPPLYFWFKVQWWKKVFTHTCHVSYEKLCFFAKFKDMVSLLTFLTQRGFNLQVKIEEKNKLCIVKFFGGQLCILDCMHGKLLNFASIPKVEIRICVKNLCPNSKARWPESCFSKDKCFKIPY